MFCIKCLHPSTHVSNSRASKKQPSIWRRRHCPQCDSVFTTREYPDIHTSPARVQHREHSEPFNLSLIVISIASAFSHAPDKGNRQALWLAQTVEARLAQEQILTPTTITMAIYTTLQQFDELAAIQYAARHGLVSTLKRRQRSSPSSHGQQTDESPSL
jgi:transcriptional regulator NrdR family protein